MRMAKRRIICRVGFEKCLILWKEFIRRENIFFKFFEVFASEFQEIFPGCQWTVIRERWQYCHNNLFTCMSKHYNFYIIKKQEILLGYICLSKQMYLIWNFNYHNYKIVGKKVLAVLTKPQFIHYKCFLRKDTFLIHHTEKKRVSKWFLERQYIRLFGFNVSL